VLSSIVIVLFMAIYCLVNMAMKCGTLVCLQAPPGAVHVLHNGFTRHCEICVAVVPYSCFEEVVSRLARKD